MNDLYATLELTKDAKADELKANYRRLAMKWHPDRNRGSSEAEEKFKRISEAYATLSDPLKRRDYDLNPAMEQGSRAGRGSWTASGGRPDSGYDFARGASAFSAEQAAFMFMNEMYALASELTMRNVGWQEIAQELERRGCPGTVAASIAQQIEIKRKAMIRGNAKTYFVRSAVSGFSGLCLVSLFGGFGFSLLGILGVSMFLSGIYNLIRAFYFIITGAAPRTRTFP